MEELQGTLPYPPEGWTGRTRNKGSYFHHAGLFTATINVPVEWAETIRGPRK